ncbi:hypothetical protein [Chryseobacterium daecheongense]|uniref:Outer membrane protein beta-barrel domain-containing protein n=1 Tax=Chryseobacterium daecheongense TaxID=192389 RepID=A0A3N0VU59_9FLAO|nr:hypothetical protein [Chryseobacterium daecheongense]ROH96030.1 hypothetical protein EGI05_16090 [Chryseobacterium daecheongense]TDX91562.1 hypothetical protein BCF50_2698 [Chryseobacterium daecheongense]
MKKLMTSLFLIISGSIFSQVAVGASQESNNRWTFGGGIGFGFGSNNYFNLSAAPRAGYKLTDDLEGGLLGSVSWQKSNAYSSTMFGVGPFLNYYIARTFYLGANYQHYFINYKDKIYDFKANTNEDALYLGGGYMQRIGNNSFMQIGIMYNVLWKENESVFSSGLVPNIGFVVGL